MTIYIQQPKSESAVNKTHWVCVKITEDQKKAARNRRISKREKKGKRSVFMES